MADQGSTDWVGLLNGGVELWESMPGRNAPLSDLGGSVLTTQVMLSVAVPVRAGAKIANIAMRSGATAAGTPTNWWFALYDVNLALIDQTADQLTAAWGANTTKDLALGRGTYVATQTGVLYAAVMVKATTTPSLVGTSMFNTAFSDGLITGQKVLAQTSGAALTTTAPATIATPTTVVNRPLVVLH